MTGETRRKMSLSRAGHATSEHTKSKISAANRGRKAVHKNGVVKMVKQEYLSGFLSNGWEIGKR